MAALDAAADAQAEWAATAPRERGEILRRAYEADRRARRRARAADDARDGQAAGRVAAPRSPTRPSSCAGSPRRPCASTAATCVSPTGKGRLLTMRQPVGPCLFDHAVELPDWRWARARSARRSPPAARWSSSPPQQTPLSMLALAQILERGRAARRRAERDHRQALGRGDRRRCSTDPRAAQAVVHRLDRGRAHS